MATKTFEELKQLAIQIRDEKTNKQNTATRVGTAMLEHINKLEQDYYDKTQTDEELKERDNKLTELGNKIEVVDNKEHYEILESVSVLDYEEKGKLIQDDGSLVENPNRNTSNLITVNSGDEFIVSNLNTDIFISIAAYDENQNFLPIYSIKGAYYGKYIVRDNVKKLRFSGMPTDSYYGFKKVIKAYNNLIQLDNLSSNYWIPGHFDKGMKLVTTFSNVYKSVLIRAYAGDKIIYKGVVSSPQFNFISEFDKSSIYVNGIVGTGDDRLNGEYIVSQDGFIAIAVSMEYEPREYIEYIPKNNCCYIQQYKVKDFTENKYISKVGETFTTTDSDYYKILSIDVSQYQDKYIFYKCRKMDNTVISAVFYKDEQPVKWHYMNEGSWVDNLENITTIDICIHLSNYIECYIEDIAQNFTDDIRIKKTVELGEVLLGYYIGKDTGIITKAYGNSYKTAKVCLDKGWYLLRNIGGGSQDSCWIYDSDNFQNPIKKIFGNLPEKSNKICYLENTSYMAISWNDLDDSEIVNGTTQIYEIDTINTDNNYSNKNDIIRGRKYNGFEDFSFDEEFYTVDKKRAISKGKESSGTWINDSMLINQPTFEDEFNMSIQFIPDNSFKFYIGKYATLAGTMVSITSNKIGICNVNNNSELVEGFSKDLSFNINANTLYTLSIKKRVTDSAVFNISISDDYGNSEEILVKSIGEADINYGVTSDIGYFWGKPAIYVESGIVTFENFSYGYSVKDNLQLMIIGHSFIEGNSIAEEKDKRFAYLFANEIGLDRCIISGQGGGTTISIMTYLDKFLQWFPNTKYILFCVGVNDEWSLTADKAFENMRAIESKVKICGIEAIWMLVNPKSTGYTDYINKLNELMSNSDLTTVDVNAAFESEKGIVNSAAFLSDGIHPTVETHNKIFSLLKKKIPYVLYDK